MKVKMITTVCGPKINISAGQVADLPEKTAKELIKAKSAVALDVNDKAVEMETASVEPKETADATPKKTAKKK